ncbi:lipopolysaccharide biosynthesis protein [Caulobacter sp. RL271]|jgi:O-antigen/teichoic acid export membrane protein|uniref:Lipopolysaccharide biosynthesis protein n=1 Tax=Caulobacter segnis TaxID=88688 RepID=A0ABY4ZMS4_9CAUL|nr:lipopolysaccharide biosynthesis protein [Caulobacter segnis]USQ94097.1 lipopolysaccharide biosynthesis protein [Caulobacter segnis]
MSDAAPPDLAPPGTKPVSPLKKVLANAGQLLSGRVVNAVVGLAYIALTYRSLGKEAAGVLVLINAFAQFLGEAAHFQSWQTLITYGAAPLLDDDKRRFQQVLRLSMLLDLISGVLGVILGVLGAWFFWQELRWPEGTNGYGALYALSIGVMTSATGVGLLRLFDRFRFLAAEQAISSFVRMVGCAICAFTHAPLPYFLLAWAAGTFASFAYIAAIAFWDLKRRGLLRGFSLIGPTSQDLPGVWRFALATNFSGTLDVGFTHVLTMIVGAMLGPAQAASWRIGKQVADGMAKPARLMVPALYPELAKMRAAGSQQAMNKLAVQIALIGGAAAGVLLLVSLLAGYWILEKVVGPGYGAAAGVMNWQVAAAAIGVMTLPLEPMLVSMRAAGSALTVRLVVVIAYLAALGPLINTFGLTGAGAALVAAALGMGIGMYFMARRRLARLAAEEDSARTTKDDEGPSYDHAHGV